MISCLLVGSIPHPDVLDRRDLVAVDVGDTIHHQKRVAMWQKLLDLFHVQGLPVLDALLNDLGI